MSGLDIQMNLEQINQRIAQAAANCSRQPNNIQLVAVSKFHPLSNVEASIQAGQFVFGENRIQEAKEKFTDLLADNPKIKLHIIGPIQTNKIVEAVKIATVIETLDRAALLDPLEKAMHKTGKSPKLFIQINIGDESQKSGIPTHEADDFIGECLERFGSQIQGVMGIPPVDQDPAPYFQQLASFAHRHQLPEISMGMSADFETAIACGATFVRVGSAIFGARPAQL